ncbi:hypothetical protein BH11ACT2_BH11ACT2_15460 [soil metagenome]
MNDRLPPPAAQAKKLGLTPGVLCALDSAPDGWRLEEPFPLTDAASVDVLIAFCTSEADLRSRLSALASRIYPAGALWIAWPRRAAGRVSDLGDQVVRTAILELGLVDTKVAAIDTDWSGLKVVWRVANRQGATAPV